MPLASGENRNFYLKFSASSSVYVVSSRRRLVVACSESL